MWPTVWLVRSARCVLAGRPTYLPQHSMLTSMWSSTVSSMMSSAPRADARAACMADQFSHGVWTRAPGSNVTTAPTCESYEYRNDSCLPARTEAALCSALSCRSLLFVGDSTVYRTYLSLVEALHGERRKDTTWSVKSCSVTGKFDDGTPNLDDEARRRTDPVEYTLVCGGCARLSFWRHDWLTRDTLGRSFGKYQGTSCDGWLDEPHGMRTHDLLLLSFGAHLHDPGMVNISGLPHPAHSANTTEASGRRPHHHQKWEQKWEAFHTARASDLCRRLELQRSRHRRPPKIIYMLAWWGQLDWTDTASSKVPPPASDSAMQPDAKYSWDAIPRINEIYTKAIRTCCVDTVIVDPTRALASRTDCRMDELHPLVPLLIASVAPMIAAAVGALDDERAQDRDAQLEKEQCSRPPPPPHPPPSPRPLTPPWSWLRTW